MGKILRTLLIILAVSMPMWPGATAASDPIVYALLFWSKTCPHCHYVIEEVLPPIHQRYGSQFRLKMLEMGQPGSVEAYRSAVQLFNVPPERQGVPALIIGDQILVGSREIPEQLPGLIEHYLANGGVAYPPLAGLDLTVGVEVCGTQPCTTMAAGTPTATTADPAPHPASVVAPTPDPVANTLAGAVLVGLAASLIYAPLTLARAAQRDRDVKPSPTQRPRSGGRADQPARWSWLIPVLSVVGLAVASYLAYTKLAHSDVICGPVGDCDAVQLSPYSELLGIPVALLGGLAYLGILFFWVTQRMLPEGMASVAQWTLFSLAIVGAAFSFYLTFLEPFVIGAVCVWCLTSAMCMALILLLASVELRRWRRAPGR
ncbi:MAG: vitamin K epoxide reductase family protein [Anaerolineae bacterium]